MAKAQTWSGVVYHHFSPVTSLAGESCPPPRRLPSGLKATAPTFPVVGHSQEVLPSHLEGFPVPGAVGGDPLVGREAQLSPAPFIDDGELLPLFVGDKVGHGQEDLQERAQDTRLLLGARPWWHRLRTSGSLWEGGGDEAEPTPIPDGLGGPAALTTLYLLGTSETLKHIPSPGELGARKRSLSRGAGADARAHPAPASGAGQRRSPRFPQLPHFPLMQSYHFS